MPLCGNTRTAAGALEEFSLLKSRVISASILILFIAAVVVFNDIFPLALNIAVAAISFLGVIEIVKALGLSQKLVLLLPSLAFAAITPFLPGTYWHSAAYYIYTVVLFSSLIFYHDSVTFRETGVIYSMTMLIPTALETLLSIRSCGGSHGMFYVIITVFAAWAADVGAFVAGTLWGKHKLCPSISPKKTVEGFIGGFVLNIAAMLAFGFVFERFYGGTVPVNYLSLALIGLFSAGLSVVGDLSFSLIKRSCHIKDFSNILPGHGGILDRFDSVIFVAPFVLLLVQQFPITPP